jgi:hypothetical protein
MIYESAMIFEVMILIIMVGMISGDQACRACAHWLMNEVNRPANAEGWQANFGQCLFQLPNLPFWASPVVGKQRMTAASAGESCSTFSLR